MNDYGDVRLIGLVGKAGSGKDTLADEISVWGWEKAAFADSLKRMCMDYLGLSHDDAYTQEGKMRFNETWGMTNRAILQKVGTDAMRNGFDKEVWVKILGIKIKRMLDEGRKVVVTDCRFDNECQMIEDMGGIVVEVVRDVESNLSGEEQSHASEQPVDRGFVAFTIDNNREPSRLREAFDASMSAFAARRADACSVICSAAQGGCVSERLGGLAVLSVKKFLWNAPRPDAVLPMPLEGAVRLEWNGAGEYPECSIELRENGIMFFAGSQTHGDERMEFGFGDLGGWNAAVDFIKGKCKVAE